MNRIPARIRLKVLIFCVFVAPLLSSSGANALGLGPIELQSKLNEPLSARIPLSRVGPNDLQELKVKLGDDGQFQRAGIEKTFLLTKIRFEVVGTGGSGHVRVTTRDPVPEPYLNFLVEALWARGRVVREYSVLLDPPVYGAAIASRAKTKVKNLVGQAPSMDAGATSVATSSARTADGSGLSAAGTGAGYRPVYGPVQQRETLWSIATRVLPAPSINVQQMMLAILRANPEAFSFDNINALRAGSVLRIPDTAEVASMAPAEDSLAEVRRHQAVWEEYRQSLAGGTMPSPGQADAGATQSAVADLASASGSDKPGTDSPVLRGVQPQAVASPQGEMRTATEEVDPLKALLADAGKPDNTSADAGAQETQDKLNILSAQGSKASDEQLGALREQLNLASEEADARQRENADLQSRLSQAEELIGDLQRLVDLRNAELASLQEQLSKQQAAAQLQGESPGANVMPQIAGSDTASPMGTSEPSTSSAAATAADSAQKTAAAQQSPDIDKTPTPAAAQKAPAKAPKRPTRVVQAPEQQSLLEQINELTPVPQPAILGVIGAALLGFGALRWMSKRKAANQDSADEAAHSGTDPYSDMAQNTLPEQSAVVSDRQLAEEMSGAGGIAGAALGSGTNVEDQLFEDPASRTLIEGPEDTGGRDLSDTSARPLEATTQPLESEDDPLAEVNVYLAYERFDQAEQLVKGAIKNYPNNADYKLKLLEVYQASGNPEGFERTAAELKEQVGEESEAFGRARQMWDQLAPGRALFAAGALAAAGVGGAMAASGDDDGMFDVTFGATAVADVLEEAEATNVDFDLGFDLQTEEKAGSEAESAGSASDGLDFDVGESIAGDVAGADSESGIDFDLGSLDGDEGDELAAGTALDLDLGDLTEVPERVDASRQLSEGTGLDFDLGTFDSRMQPLTQASDDEQSGLELELGAATLTEQSSITGASGDMGLDFDLDDGSGSSVLQSDALSAPSDGTESALDFDLGSLDEDAGAAPAGQPAGAFEELLSESGLDLDFGTIDEPPNQPRGEAPTVHAVSGSAAEARLGQELAEDIAIAQGEGVAQSEDAVSDPGAQALGDSDDDDDFLGLNDELDLDLGEAETMVGGAVDLDLDDGVARPEFGAGSSSIDLDLSGISGATQEPLASLERTAQREGTAPEGTTVRTESRPSQSSPVNAQPLGMQTLRLPDTMQAAEADSLSGASAAGVFGDLETPAVSGSGTGGMDTDIKDIFAGADSQDTSAGAFSDLEMETDDADLLAGFGELPPGGDAESLRKTHVLPSGGDTEVGTPEDDNAVVSTLVLDTGESSQIDEMQTKLDLARAYMDIGDTVGAKNLLGEVMAEGNDMQQHSARELLGEIA